MTEAKARQADTNENTYTHCPSTPKAFSHAVAGWPEGQLVMGMDARSPPTPLEAPPCSIYSWPCVHTHTHGPFHTLTAYYLRGGKEIAEQCGRSETGHKAQGRWQPVDSLAALLPPPPPPHPPSHFISLKVGLPQPVSLPSRHPCETSRLTTLPHFSL